MLLFRSLVVQMIIIASVNVTHPHVRHTLATPSKLSGFKVQGLPRGPVRLSEAACWNL